MIAVYILCGLLALCLLTAFICFLMAFYSPRKKDNNGFSLPPGEIYLPYHDLMKKWNDEVSAMAHESVWITSHDGLRLHGKYYEYAPGAPMELMLHGYRGSAERDLCGGVQRAFALGRNVLIVDQRACGKSEGRVITFGIKESLDCLGWIDYIVKRFGKEQKIILTGISMGASTVLCAAGHDLPEQVVGVLADCGFTSPRAIIGKVIRQMGLPEQLLYPFVRLGGMLFGGFDVEANSSIESVARCKLPVIFIHGEVDDYVPCEMSRENYEACTCPKRLVTVPEAGHGMAYLVDGDEYLRVLAEFFTENGLKTEVIGTKTQH